VDTASAAVQVLWEEVKQEADFYQVPELKTLTPDLPVMVILPEETVVVRRFTLTAFETKRGTLHYLISDDDVRQLPPDLAQKVYTLAPYAHCPMCLHKDDVVYAGFEAELLEDDDANDSKWACDCKEKVVHYANAAGTLLQVAELNNEVLREDCPYWIRITCRLKVGNESLRTESMIV